MANSESFQLLHPLIQKYIWQEKWDELREVQEIAIPFIKPAKVDVIIAASTAAGKTEAAYLPALSHLLEIDCVGLIVGIFPLKALINDQFGRLTKLCKDLDIPVYPWHGDISKSNKDRFYKERKGVLLITPESLEALLCNRGTGIKGFFEFAKYLIVDELHYYIGSERGKQLQSLLHRIEIAHGKKLPRIGLSATLGELSLAAEYLRPNSGSKVIILEAKDSTSSVKIQLKGYERFPKIKTISIESLVEPSVNNQEIDAEDKVSKTIAEHIFKNMHGSNNLIYPNSRTEVERFTFLLSSYCEQLGISNEFWPHHGNLSKEIREETEAALKSRERPASAICTSTLELGIDIGSVKSVAQIGAPPSVSSLRQRLGRSGRLKGESAILRAYIEENSINDKSGLSERLRLKTVKTCAMITLLLEGWFEPPAIKGKHFSTLIQQILSAISQYGGIQAAQAYNLFCSDESPFSATNKEEFLLLLKAMGTKELIIQDSSGLLLHGKVGEKCVNHYSFYAAFASDEEYRVIVGSKTLGTMPVSNMLVIGQHILLGGKQWLVLQIEDTEKTIYVARANATGRSVWSGPGTGLHTVVAQRMRNILRGNIELGFLDLTARRFIDEGIKQYANLNLDKVIRVDNKLITWMGTEANGVLYWKFKNLGVSSKVEDCLIDCNHLTNESMNGLIMNRVVDIDDLLRDAKTLTSAKWDWALPKALLNKTFASLHLNIEEAEQWLKDNKEKLTL